MVGGINMSTIDERWNIVQQTRAFCQKVLPLVYDESLSYMEMVCKMSSKLNEIIENNNNLPDYIKELIKEIVNSDDFTQIVGSVLMDTIINVKFPPEGITRAKGDGVTDDTKSIQDCLNYANEHGGATVFFPSGKYLTNTLSIASETSILGADRYNTSLILKGGGNTPLLQGVISQSIRNIHLDGNRLNQIEENYLIDGDIENALIDNVIFSDSAHCITSEKCNANEFCNVKVEDISDNVFINGTGDNNLLKNINTLYEIALVGNNNNWQSAVQTKVDNQEPLIYKKPDILNGYFNSIPMQNNGDVYQVLVKSSAMNNFITPQLFGAKGDGITDDTDAFQKSIDYCIANNVGLYVPVVGLWDNNKGYILSKTLNITHPMVFITDKNVILNWKNAHLNTDTSSTTGENNSVRYNAGYGINIDYGTYRGHKGYYSFGIIQGDKSFIYPGGSVPSGHYWTGVRIANGDIIDFNAQYISYWEKGMLIESSVDDALNSEIYVQVFDDCQTGVEIKSNKSAALMSLYFNTIGLCKYGIIFDATNGFINNITIRGQQIFTEYKDGCNIYSKGTNDNLQHVLIEVSDCKNTNTEQTLLKTGDGSEWKGPAINGEGGFFKAIFSTICIGVYNGPMTAGEPIQILVGGFGTEVKNTWLTSSGSERSPILCVSSTQNESDFNGGLGGALPGRSGILSIQTEKNYVAGDIETYKFYSICAGKNTETNICITPLNAYKEVELTAKSNTYSNAREILVIAKFLQDISANYEFKFFANILDIK